MQRPLSKLARLFLAFAILIASGGHWAALQSVAWTRMLVVNARHSTIVAALEKTFDGRHPCNLCQSIASAKAKEKKLPRVDTLAKIVFFCEQLPGEFSPLLEMESHGARRSVWKSVTAAPALPPPRSAAV